MPYTTRFDTASDTHIAHLPSKLLVDIGMFNGENFKAGIAAKAISIVVLVVAL
jgi:hypothetical protein